MVVSVTCKNEEDLIKNQRTNGPVNAHLISGPNISTKQKQGQEMTLTLNNHFHLLN